MTASIRPVLHFNSQQRTPVKTATARFFKTLLSLDVRCEGGPQQDQCQRARVPSLHRQRYGEDTPLLFCCATLKYYFFTFRNNLINQKAAAWKPALLTLPLLLLSQLCPTLRDPIDGSPPGSPVPGILQARTLEWVVISFSNAWEWKLKVKSLSRVRLFVTPWTAAYQALPSMGFSRQEYWSGCHCLLCFLTLYMH